MAQANDFIDYSRQSGGSYAGLDRDREGLESTESRAEQVQAAVDQLIRGSQLLELDPEIRDGSLQLGQGLLDYIVGAVFDHCVQFRAAFNIIEYGQILNDWLPDGKLGWAWPSELKV